MLKLYHAAGSVCSIKARIGLAEKQLQWESCLIDLHKGEQFAPEYIKLNPNAVVPTLDHDGFIVIESSVILQYIDALNKKTILIPQDLKAETITRLWLIRCIDIHAAINTMTFSTVARENILAANTAEEIEQSINNMPNPKAAAKRKDLIQNGVASIHVDGDFFTLKRMFEDMQSALEQYEWLTGHSYGLADTAIVAYVDRLDRLGMSGMWKKQFPQIDRWLTASKARPSYKAAIDPFISQEETEKVRSMGDRKWPEVKKRWDNFIVP